jgi:hypothetical protein
MSTTNSTNITTPKAGKYGNAPKASSPIAFAYLLYFYSATWELWAESQPNYLGFVLMFPGESLLDRGTYRCDTVLGCMSYGSTKWQEWLLGEKDGLEHIKFA